MIKRRMIKLITALMLSTMLTPALADSIRPGSRPLTGVQKRSSKGPSCLVLEDDGEMMMYVVTLTSLAASPPRPRRACQGGER